jgi:hypothetical protein
LAELRSAEKPEQHFIDPDLGRGQGGKQIAALGCDAQANPAAIPEILLLGQQSQLDKSACLRSDERAAEVHVIGNHAYADVGFVFKMPDRNQDLELSSPESHQTAKLAAHGIQSRGEREQPVKESPELPVRPIDE